MTPPLRSLALFSLLLAGCADQTIPGSTDAALPPAAHPVDAAWLDGGRFEVDLAGIRLAAKVSLRPPYDSAGARIKL